MNYQHYFILCITPVIILLCHGLDLLTSQILPQKQFIKRVKNGEHRLVKGAKHEIYRSPDEVLFPWWHEVLEFLT